MNEKIPFYSGNITPIDNYDHINSSQSGNESFQRYSGHKSIIVDIAYSSVLILPAKLSTLSF